MDMEACTSLLAAMMSDPVPAGDKLDAPALWGLGYGGTRQDGHQGATHHEQWLLVMPVVLGGVWAGRKFAVSLGLGTLPICAMASAYLCFRLLSVSLAGSIFKASGVVLRILAISSNVAWKQKDPRKVWCMEKCHCDIQCFWTC